MRAGCVSGFLASDKDKTLQFILDGPGCESHDAFQSVMGFPVLDDSSLTVPENPDRIEELEATLEGAPAAKIYRQLFEYCKPPLVIYLITNEQPVLRAS
ncbi:MAG: hypothetical protein M3Q70_02265 [bacterium]|nr:hypothetical protein [bacterium]